MKKVVSFIAVALIAISSTVSAQKVAHISLNDLLLLMPERKKAEADIQEYAKQLDSQLKSMSAEYEAKVGDYQAKEAMMTEPIKMDKEKEIAGLEDRIKEFQQTAQESLQKKQNELLEPMVNKAKTNYPNTNFVKGDVLDANPNLGNEKFTHILCLYFTIYYIENKEMFFENCMKWLKPGGFLILHVVDRDSFDPIIPAGQGFLIFSPQKYAKERINTSKVVFNNFIYSSKFDLKPSENIGSFDEKIEFKDNKSIRKHKHVMYMEDAPELLTRAQNCGFIINDKVDLLNCGYDNQYLYILVKPA